MCFRAVDWFPLAGVGGTRAGMGRRGGGRRGRRQWLAARGGAPAVPTTITRRPAPATAAKPWAAGVEGMGRATAAFWSGRRRFARDEARCDARARASLRHCVKCRRRIHALRAVTEVKCAPRSPPSNYTNTKEDVGYTFPDHSPQPSARTSLGADLQRRRWCCEKMPMPKQRRPYPHPRMRIRNRDKGPSWLSTFRDAASTIGAPE